MEAKAEKTGDSLTFRIPKPIVNKCKLMEGSAVDIALRGDEMVMALYAFRTGGLADLGHEFRFLPQGGFVSQPRVVQPSAGLPWGP